MLVYIQKGGCTNIPEHAGLKRVAFLSIGMVGKVEGESTGWPERPFSFSQMNILANPTHFLIST